MRSFAESLPALEPLSRSTLRTPVDYRGYRELLESWSSLENARVQRIGRSVLGEPLWMVEVGAPKATKVSAVIAGIHPIEWIGIETAFSLARSISKNPSDDRRVCFFPLTNPDGFRKVEANLRDGKRRWVRSNENGVDLNRNWPTHFRASTGLLAGHNASGPSACSEPEVSAIVSTLDRVAVDASIDIALSLHSIGNMILMPWGGIWKSPHAREEHLRVANKLKMRLGNYTVRQVSHWFPGISFAHGMEIDHLHQAYDATSILIECTRGEVGTLRPSAYIDPFRIFNPQNGRERAATIAAALEPFVRGAL
ncbi:MAG: hypothetical protein GY811_17465 [Myxococcales bacterium]|nr:hypothetical protein [Myxococcales bacterium]